MCSGTAKRLLSFLAGLVLCNPALVSAQERLDFADTPDGRRSFPELLINAGGTGFAGLATIYNGQPVIFYDVVWVRKMGGLDSPMFAFVRAHEYGHHRRGHVTQQYRTPPQMMVMLGYQSELDADCWAVHTLRDNGDDAAVRAAFDLYAQTVPLQDSQGRPGTARRHAEMRRCLASR